MSRHRREQQRLRKVILKGPLGVEYSEETMSRLKALEGRPGVNQVGIFHQGPCADALRAGSRKCTCTPEIRLIQGIQDGRAVEMGLKLQIRAEYACGHE